MTKFIHITLIIALAAVCYAGPARLRNLRQSRFSARQEVAEDIPSQTPYPPAGIVPEVRFDLPTEDVAVEPDNTYLPPDNVGGIPAETYGPPEADNDDEDVAAVEAETDQPEQSAEEEQVPVNDEAENNEIENPQSGRLVARRPFNSRSSKLQARPAAPVRSQRLVVQPLRSQRLVAQPIYFADGRLFAYSPQFLRV